MLLSFVGLVWDPKLYRKDMSEKQLNEVLKLLLWDVFVANETKTNVKTVEMMLGKLLLDVHRRDFYYKERIFRFVLMYKYGDNKNIQFALQNKCGNAKNRCCKCSYDISAKGVWGQTEGYRKEPDGKVRKTIYNLWIRYWCNQRLAEKRLSSIGGESNGLPSFAGSDGLPFFLHPWVQEIQDKSLCQNRASGWLQPIKIGVEGLHSAKGFLLGFINSLTNLRSKMFKSRMFQGNLMNAMNRNSLSELDGQHLRILSLQYERIILPCIESESMKSVVANVFSVWLDLQWIMYCDPRLMTCKGIKLRAHILVFNLHIALLKYSQFANLKSLYLHEILYHLTDQTDIGDLRSSLAEQGESCVGSCKRVITKCSNRKLENLCGSLVRHILYSDIAKDRKRARGQSTAARRIQREWAKRGIKELSWNREFINSNRERCQRILSSLKEKHKDWRPMWFENRKLTDDSLMFVSFNTLEGPDGIKKAKEELRQEVRL